MSETPGSLDEPVKRWWTGFAIALFLLVPLDLLITLIAVARYGTAVEGNPIMRWLLQQGLVPVIVVHLAVIGVATSMFHVAVQSVWTAAQREQRLLVRFLDLWTGCLILAGVLLTSSNLLQII